MWTREDQCRVNCGLCYLIRIGSRGVGICICEVYEGRWGFLFGYNEIKANVSVNILEIFILD